MSNYFKKKNLENAETLHNVYGQGYVTKDHFVMSCCKNKARNLMNERNQGDAKSKLLEHKKLVETIWDEAKNNPSHSIDTDFIFNPYQSISVER